VKVGDAHLTYCTNIHAGETWPDVRANLERYVLAVKQRVCPAKPFGVGLRLSARAAAELAQPNELAQLRRFLDRHDMYVFTINGFPAGTFHGERVKENVYRPDWLEHERVAYTNLLVKILGELLPPGGHGSISTVPLCFRERGNDRKSAGRNIERCLTTIIELHVTYGKHITLALEPEPACAIETIAEAVEFLDTDMRGEYLGICFDACHAAVEFEDLAAALAKLRSHDIPIAKIQLSCGLRVTPVDAAARAELARFAEDTYLHQTVARRGDVLTRYVDLPDALADDAPADEWRIHFHVPIFREALGRFASTQPFLAELLAAQRASKISPHLEVETYTWDVLPAEFRAEPIEDAIARELLWVKERL
jgi:sugar phosphate isomerase/epimerase